MSNERSSYRQIEHTADLGVEVTAPDLAGLFAAAGEALYALIVDPETIESRDVETVTATGNGPEELLHGWLCELLALFNIKSFIGKRCEVVRISENQIEGKIGGEQLNLERHRFHTEIKGVTYHDFKIWEEAGSWHARIIFDV
ncbi:MAG TPA: archease [Candidatus Binatia bacterium]|nr:archease [Candidatus Binatia bacterium]